jgi:ACS family glucarate transporter-like MFS transporter
MYDASEALPRARAGPTGVRHAVVALATLMAVLLYLDRVCLSFLERSIRQDLHLTTDESGLLLSAFFWTYALAQVPCGWLSDRFGARLILALYILGWSLCTGLMGLAHSFAALLLWRFGCGLAQAGAYPTSAGLLSKWVPFAARGLASGIVSTGGRVGGFIAPVVTAYLLLAFLPPGASAPDAGPEGQLREANVAAWRPTVLVYGAAGVAVALLFWVVVRDAPAQHPWCNAAEVALIERDRPPGSASPHGPAGTLPLRALLTSKGLWLSSVSQFATNFGWVFLITLLPRYLAERFDVPIRERGWLAGLPLLVGMAGMLSGGWLTDVLTRALGLRWGRCLPMALTRFVATAAFVACLACDAAWQATVALAVVAVATDLGTPAVWAYMQDAGGRHVGSVLGWGNMWGNLGAAMSPLALSPLIDAGGWDTCFLACAAAFFMAGVAALGIDATVPIAPPEAAD